MTSAPTQLAPSLDVSLNVENSVTICEQCGQFPAKRRFCSNKCRQSAYRVSPTHGRNLLKQSIRRAIRRTEWTELKNRDKHLSFDGLFSGPSVNWAGPLGKRTLPELESDWQERRGLPPVRKCFDCHKPLAAARTMRCSPCREAKKTRFCRCGQALTEKRVRLCNKCKG
jgi:hypothetical protein